MASVAGNPSSIHAEGRGARDRVERARVQVTNLIERRADQVVFTSGGTEANLLGVAALAAFAERDGRPKVVATTALEHPSLRGAVAALAEQGWEVRTLLPFTDASLDGIGLLAVALVNHELGALLPAALVERATTDGVLVHLDAVQAVGKIAVPRADAIALSAHKLGGPQGIGALAIAHDGGLPLVDGGHQERGRRPGTENVLGIVGFGAAAAAIDQHTWPQVAALGDRLERGLVALGARIHGDDRVGGTISAAFPGTRGHDIVMALDLAGIAASTGAACTSGTVQPSPVLLALGLPPEQALEAVRFSLGRSTTAAEIDEVLGILPAIVDRARRFHG